MTQPAERIRNPNATNTTTTLLSGCPAPAIHKAHNVGHSSSRLPIGRSRRINNAYWRRRSITYSLPRRRRAGATACDRSPCNSAGKKISLTNKGRSCKRNTERRPQLAAPQAAVGEQGRTERPVAEAGQSTLATAQATHRHYRAREHPRRGAAQ